VEVELTLFGGSRKFISELDAPSVNWKRLVSLSRGGINASAKARKSGKTVFHILLDRIVTDKRVPMEQLDKLFSNLVRKGTDLNIQMAPGGETALHIATRSEKTRFVEILLSNGASPVSVSDDGTTPLHIAAGIGAQVISELLVKAGADVNAEDSRSNTPLHLAVSLPDAVNLVELLLSQGALAFARNTNDQTPSAIARASGNSEYIELLRKKLADMRSSKDNVWKCPGCGNTLERPDGASIEWTVEIGMWEFLNVTCGRCGRITEARVLDGEI